MHAQFQTHQHAFLKNQTRSLAYRKAQLSHLARMLLEQEKEWIQALSLDLGKSRFESITNELGVLHQELRHTIKHLPRWMKQRKVFTPFVHFPSRSWVTYEPKGVVLIIGPWNYPLQLILSPLIGAIAAGNCAVIKPSEFAPHTSLCLSRWLPHYLDPACFSVALGGAEETKQLLELPWNHIFFTGSTRIGRLIAQKAASSLIPVTLELGGKSPCIVEEPSDVALAAKRIVWGKLLNAGQTCIAPDYLLVHQSDKQALVEALQKAIVQFYGKDPSKNPDYGKIIHEAHCNRLANLLKGQSILAGGTWDIKNRYFAPTLVDEPKWDSPLMQEEIFGPILPILSYSSLKEAIQYIARLPAPLTTYAFSHSQEILDYIQLQTKSGSLCINDTLSQVASPYLPFGGFGQSGMGMYHGEWSFQTLSHTRPLFIRSNWLDLPLRYPPYTSFKTNVARFFLRHLP